MNFKNSLQGVISNLSPILLICGIFISLIAEGTGIDPNRSIILLIFTFFIGISFLVSIVRKELIVPRKFFIIFSLFLCSSFVSLLFAANKELGIQFFTLYTIALLSFLTAHSHKTFLQKSIPYILFSASVIFTLSYILSIVRLPFLDFSLAQKNGYQFIISLESSYHNHLGDFLALPFIFLLLNQVKKNTKWVWIVIVLLLSLIIFSFSRSAMTMVVFTSSLFVGLKQVKGSINKLYPLLGILIPLLFLLLFTLGTQELRNETNKTLLGERNIYYTTALETVKDKPLLGVGPGNYLYSSFKFNSGFLHHAQSAHNIFLDMTAETGIIGFLLFFLIIFAILICSKRTLLFYLFFAMFINFQFDYTHRMYSFFVLFFIIAGLCYEEKKYLEKAKNISLIALFFLITLLITLLLFTRLAYFKDINSLYLPLTTKLQNNITRMKYNYENENLKYYLRQLEEISPEDPNALQFIASYYYDAGDKKQALSYYKKSYAASPFKNIAVAESIYQISLTEGRDVDAKDFAYNYLWLYSNSKFNKPSYITIRISEFCQKVYNYSCPFKLYTTE